MYNLSNNLGRLDKLQQQMSTGKKIQTPSDDPIVASRALKFRTDVAQIDQYQKNVDDASSWMEMTDSALSSIGDVLQRARELAVQGASGTLSTGDRQKIGLEAQQLKQQLISLSNSTYSGRYIFSGFQTDKPLVDAMGLYNVQVQTIAPNREDIKYEINISDKININVLGSELFGGVGTVGTAPKMMRDMDDLITALNTSDITGAHTAITNIDNNIQNVLTHRADVGARTNRIDLTKNRLTSDNTNFTKLMSDNEDADMAEIIMNLQNEQNVYNASLSAGAKIIQPTLIDFLK
jgi:flagellar hook-associated protein 3 FlgL